MGWHDWTVCMRVLCQTVCTIYMLINYIKKTAVLMIFLMDNVSLCFQQLRCHQISVNVLTLLQVTNMYSQINSFTCKFDLCDLCLHIYFDHISLQLVCI